MCKKLKRTICMIISVLILVTAPLMSYMEAQAVELVVTTFGEIALEDLLTTILVSAGASALGVTEVNLLDSFYSDMESLKKAIMSDDEVEAAVAAASAYQLQHEMDLVSDLNYSDKGIALTYIGGKLAVSFGGSLINRVKSKIKTWTDSDANNVAIAAGSALAGIEKVNYEYMQSIETTIKTLPTIDSMKDIESYFGIEGATEYLENEGYSDGSYYFMIYVNGSNTCLMPIPFGYCVVGAQTAYMGSKYVDILSKTAYKNAITQNGVRDGSSFRSYYVSLNRYTGKYFVYNHNNNTWTVTENKNYLPDYNRLNGDYPLSNWYTCNYKAAYEKGSVISWNNFRGAMSRILYTYETVGKNITYDKTHALDISDTDTVEFKIDEKDYSGISAADLLSLMSYVSSLSEQLEDWRKESEENQKEIIEQNASILEGINNMHQLISDISFDIGKIAADVAVMSKSVLTLSQDIADALVISLPSAIADALTDAMVVGLPAALTDALADVFPDADAINDRIDALPAEIADAIAIALPAFPEIEIPDIVIPDIVIPAIEIPDVNVTLNPAYDITVLNDYTGLDNIISGAVEDVLVGLFVPNAH